MWPVIINMPALKMAISVKSQRWLRPSKDLLLY
nr:MAG TPA: hypothetical protein [Bacteriophage sp.]